MNAKQHRKARRNYIERNKQQIPMLLMDLLLLGPVFSSYDFAKAAPIFADYFEYFYRQLKLIEMVPYEERSESLRNAWRLSQKGKDLLK